MIGTFFDLPGHNVDTLNSILAYEWENIKEKIPDEDSDVFEEEKNVQFYVNQNNFNKTYQVLSVLPDEAEEGLKEKAEKVTNIAEEVIKEHINSRIEAGRIIAQAEMPNATLEELNGYINTVWDDANKEIEAQGLSSIFEKEWWIMVNTNSIGELYCPWELVLKREGGGISRKYTEDKSK